MKTLKMRTCGGSTPILKGLPSALLATSLASLMTTPIAVSALVGPASSLYLPLRTLTCLQTRPSTSDYLSSIDTQNVASSPVATSTNATAVSTSQTRPKRMPAFPRSVYPLATDEERLEHNFISFIDNTVVSSYSQVTRLVEPRAYARADQFNNDMSDVPPTIDDIATPPSRYGHVATFLAWNRLPARIVVGAMAYLIFPYTIQFLEGITKDVTYDQLATLVNTFLPGVSIVLGTYFSLTLSILYDRFARIQQTVSLEAAFLALTCQNLLDLFFDDANSAVEGAQCVADQIRILVRESRGRETMGVIYSDPYARILKLVTEQDRESRRMRSLDSVSALVKSKDTLRFLRRQYL
jgi:hypothetical protein